MIVAVIQARMGSTRLPRKITQLIAGKSMLERVIERVQQIPDITSVWVAAPREPTDWIPDHAKGVEVCLFEGPADDVLSRYALVARSLHLAPHDLILRITADCPALDPQVSHQVIALQAAFHGEYAANTRDWPDGLDTEVFTASALRDADYWAKTPEDREHVTPWMRRNLFCTELPHVPSLRHLKWSVDTEEDLEYVRELYAVLGEDFGWGEILTADPGKLCEACRWGILHEQRSGDCRAWAICQRAAGIPRLTIDFPVPGVTFPRNPSASPRVHGAHEDR